MPTPKLIVGYKTRVVEPEIYKQLVPDFRAPANLVDKAKINAAVSERHEQFKQYAHNIPYTGTFDEVVIVDPRSETPARWYYRPPSEKKPPLCVAVRNWILSRYPAECWGDDSLDLQQPRVKIIGWSPRFFVKLLGLECSLPSIGQPLPAGMWLAVAKHRDIQEAIMPEKECKLLDLKKVLERRKPLEGDDVQKWDTALSGWDGPGQSPEKDVWFATELAGQLGWLSD